MNRPKPVEKSDAEVSTFTTTEPRAERPSSAEGVDTDRRRLLMASVAVFSALAGVCADRLSSRLHRAAPFAPTGSNAHPPRQPIVCYPLGDGQDDAPNLQEVFSDYAGDAAVQLAAGTWTLLSTCRLPPNLVLFGGPDVRIVTALTTAGSPEVGNCAFFAAATPTGIGSTLAATNTVGSDTLVLNDPFAIGSVLQIGSASTEFQMCTYTVVAVSGAGPYEVTLDRPILYQFAPGDPANLVTNVPSNIKIYGRGMTVSGACVRYFEIVTGIDCVIEDVIFDRLNGSASDMCASFDCGGVRNVFRNISADGGGALGSCCLALESNEGSTVEHCDLSFAGTGYGLGLYDCVRCEVIGCHLHDSRIGLAVGGDGDLVGCRHCKVFGGSFDGNTIGVYVGWGSSNNEFVGFTANQNLATGIIFDGAGEMDGNRARHFAATDNGGHGVHTRINNGMRTYLEHCDLSNNGGFCLYAQSNTSVDGLHISDNVAQPRIYQDILATTLTLHNISVSANPATPQNVILNVNGLMLIDGAIIIIGPYCNGISVECGSTAGKTSVSNARIAPVGAMRGEIGIYQSHGILCVGSAVDASPCATPIRIDAGLQDCGG